jgi:ABC-2 type transport system permease protein
VAANLRRQSRDHAGLFFILIMPFVVVALVGLAMGGRAGGTPRLAVGLVAQASGPSAQALIEALRARPDLDVVRVADPDRLRIQVREGSLAAGLVLPPELDRSPLPDTVSLEFIATQTSGDAAAARTAVGAVVGEQAEEIGARRTAERLGASTEQAGKYVAQARLEVTPVTVAARTVTGQAVLAGFDYSAPANLVLFTFVNSMALAGWLVETRRLRISQRARAAPVRTSAILAGEALSRMVIAVGQSLLVIVVTTLGFGVHWGDPLALAAVVGGLCLVSTGAAMLAGGLLRTGAQAAAIGPSIGIVLGMLGGCMWPQEIAGPLLDRIGHLFPHAWAVDALLTIATPGRGLADIVTPLSVLVGMAVVLTAASLLQFRRAIS